VTDGVKQNHVAELTLRSKASGPSAFADVELDCDFLDPSGRTRRVPGFWRGDNTWGIRYASPIPGTHRYTTRSSDPKLAGVEGEIEVVAYTGDNVLLRHGPIGVDDSGRHFLYTDSQPFLWAADTWWYGFVERLKTEEFAAFAQARAAQGFNVVQIVAGLYPEMASFAERGNGAHGWPWTEEFGCINPAWWDDADERIQLLVDASLIPCVVGAWGYYMPWLGVERMTKHWRYVIARWGAQPVVWCIGGETRLPWYDHVFKEEMNALSREQSDQWAQVRDAICEIDGFERLVTAHPSPGDGSWSTTDVFYGDRTGSDFVMLQTGHWDKESLDPSVSTLRRELDLEPRRPVLNGEVCYEGIISSSWQETQRFLFWSHVLSGAAGHSYGAQGIWAFEVEGGSVWGDTTWKEAAEFPGARHVGAGAEFLRRFPWQTFESRPDWIAPHAHADDWRLPYAAGVPRELRLFYLPSASVLRVPTGDPVPFTLANVLFRGLEADVRYAAAWFDPRRGVMGDTGWGEVVGDDAGEYSAPNVSFLAMAPSLDDWVLVFDARDESVRG
jgi:Protein of unknown function (DUF4038)/Domain of unknown function (DUF5060)